MAYFILIFATLWLSISSCATVKAPSGGPRDSTPPEIIGFLPENKTLNFGSEERIEIQFSKYMNKGKVVENVFITPTIPLEYDWSGKKLRVKFREPLKENTTYSLQLGTEYTDFLGNNPANSFDIVFSSGADLDSGLVRGKLFDKDPAGKFVFLYNIDNVDLDTFDISKVKADYRIQIGSSGEFKYGALKNGRYRIIAIDDEFRDEKYDIGMDRYGAAPFDVDINGDSAVFVPLRLGPKVDLMPPSLNSVTAIDERTIIANFSEQLDTLSVQRDAFTLFDSTLNQEIDIRFAYLNSNSAQEVRIMLSTQMDTSNIYSLRVAKGTIADTVGNKIADSLNIARFNGMDGVDTVRLKLIGFPIADSSRGQTFDYGVKMVFNVPPIRFSKELIKLRNLTDEKELTVNLTKLNDNTYFLRPDSIMKSDKWHRLEIDMENIEVDTIYQSLDSTLKIDFLTPFAKGGSTVSGIIEGDETCSDSVFVKMISKDGKRIYSFKAKVGSDWKIENIEEGSYTFEAFCDVLGNGLYDFGMHFPYRTSAKFYEIKGEIKVKSKWDFENAVIKLEEIR